MKLKRLRLAKAWLEDRDFGGWVKARRSQVARWMAPYFTANQITLVFGLLACVPITLLYANDLYWPASILLTISLLSDFVDGSVAHHQQELRPVMTLKEEQQLTFRQRVGFKGVTHLGKVLDPLVDKVRFFCVLYVLGWGVVGAWLIIALTVVAILLTLARPVKYWIGAGDGRSNRLGQLKVWAEVLALASFVFTPTQHTLQEVTLIIALAFGLCSLAGHILSVTATLAIKRQKRRPKKRAFARPVAVLKRHEP